MVFDTTALLTLKAVTCYKCGVAFGVESGQLAQLQESHETFWCPNGHQQAFLTATEKERRIAELERQGKSLISSRDYWQTRTKDAEQEVERKGRQVNGYKGVVTRLKRRAVAGRCPCCSAQFKDLKRHMASRHPKWNPDAGAEALSNATAEARV